MKDTIAHMLEVEAQAKAVVAEADAEAESIVRTARAEATAVENQAQRDAQSAACTLLEDGLREARERRERELAAIDERLAALRNIPPEKAAAARQMIIDAVVGRAADGSTED
jgi:vacuolar-type H+-ATPase subunit H